LKTSDDRSGSFAFDARIDRNRSKK